MGAVQGAIQPRLSAERRMAGAGRRVYTRWPARTPIARMALCWPCGGSSDGLIMAAFERLVRTGHGGAGAGLCALFALSGRRRPARGAARSFPAAMSRTPLIRWASAPKPRRSRPWSRRARARIAEILVLGPGPERIAPCGACRQRIAEFARRRALVHLADEAGAVETATLSELLPRAFGPASLKGG